MHYRQGVLHIGDISAEDIANRFGTPVYVYDAAVIRRQIERVTRAFASIPFRPFYAMKANSNLGILRLIRGEGFGCDAVSPGEIHLAKSAGFASEAIWFTCSNVSDDDLRAIADPSIVINVNSLSEVDRVVALGLPNAIALRLNPDVGAGHHADVITAGGGVKFGIDLAEIETARMIVEDSGRKVVGLHAHIGSGVDTLDPLLESARRLVHFAPAFPNLRWINFGGGIAVPYRPGDGEFPIDDYGARLAEVAGRTLRERNLTAILEPGRYIIAESGTLLARTTARRVSAGVTWIGCDTGFNHLVRPSKYGAYHHIVNATRGSDDSLRTRGAGVSSARPRASAASTAGADEDVRSPSHESVVIAGNLCESGDVFTRDLEGTSVPRPIDAIHIGDLIAFCDAGAYGFSMGSHYNARLLPPEILIEGSSITLIRERQTFDDLVRGMS